MKKTKGHTIVGIARIKTIDTYGNLYAELIDNQPNLIDYEKNIIITIPQTLLELPKINDTILVQLVHEKKTNPLKKARLIRVLKPAENFYYGVIVFQKDQLYLHTLNYKSNRYLLLDNPTQKKVKAGDYVCYTVKKSYNKDRHYRHQQRRRPDKEVDIVEILDHIDQPLHYDALAIHEFNLRTQFCNDTLKHCEDLSQLKSKKHEDMSHIPFITIDPADAKDHDDAVYCHPINDGGFHVYVAIADVSFYVKPLDIIDREACLRANSVYLPYTVIPMLPEQLSNHLCSLKKGHAKLTLICIMTLNSNGVITDYAFKRGVIHIKANISYEQADEIIKNTQHINTHILDSCPSHFHNNPDCYTELKHLFDAYKCLQKTTKAREPLDIKNIEKKIVFDTKGHVKNIAHASILETHKIIEEFMIAANVCASKKLSDAGYQCLYRVHDKPNESKVYKFKDDLKKCSLKFPVTSPKPRDYNHFLQKAHTLPQDLLSQMIMATQSKAVYAPKNIGHYGLQLSDYTHFTSPIRRYADVIIHRLLIECIDSPSPKTLSQTYQGNDFVNLANHLSTMERIAIQAERKTMSRLIASYYLDKLNTKYDAQIVAMTPAGFYVQLPKTQAEAFIPKRFLSFANEKHSYSKRTKRSRNTKRKIPSFTIGQCLTVKLTEVDPLSGSLLCQIA